MNKWIRFVICGMLIMLLLAGCVLVQPETSGTTAPTTAPTDPTTTTGGPTQPTDPTDPEPTDPPRPAEPMNIPFTYLCIKTYYHRDMINYGPRVLIIRSQDDLSAYYQENASLLEKTKFPETAEQFDDAFFADHTLLLVPVWDGTTSVVYSINNVIAEIDGSITLGVHAIYEEPGTTAMGAWHLFVSVEGLIAEDTPINVESTWIIVED